MRKKNLLLLAAMAGVCVFGLISCRNRTEFSGGNPLSEEQAKELLATEPKKPETPPVLCEEEQTYYFVEGNGSVYHSEPSCTYLKKSQNVKSGTLAQVLAAGKVKLCGTCAKKQTSVLDESVTERTCYYTAGGTVWHYDRSCGALARSSDVRSGTVDSAMLDGKTRPCTRCCD